MEETKKKYKYFVIYAFCLFLAIHYWDSMIVLIGVIVAAITPLIIGCAIAYILNILMEFYENIYSKINDKNVILKKAKRPVCMGLSFVSLFGIVGMIFGIVIPELINCFKCVIVDVPPVLETWWNDFTKNELVLEYYPLITDSMPTFSELKQMITQNANAIVSNMGGFVGSVFNVVGSVFSGIVTAFVAIIFSVYLLLSKERLKKTSKLVISTYCKRSKEKIFYFFRTLNHCFKSFIIGQCTDAVILGALCTIGMFIFKFPYAIMIGVLIGFTALIPIAGAYIGAGVGAFMMLTISPEKAILFLVFVIILQQLEGNLIYPKVVGNSIGLPGMWVLAAITLGGGLMGVFGMLLSVPLFATFYKIMQDDLAKKTGIRVDEDGNIESNQTSTKIVEKGKIDNKNGSGVMKNNSTNNVSNSNAGTNTNNVKNVNNKNNKSNSNKKRRGRRR